jgi:natural product precursor
MKTENKSFENFKKNEISKRQLATILGGDFVDPKPGSTTSSPAGSGVL